MISKDFHLFLWYVNVPDQPVRVGYYRSYEALDEAKATCDTTKAYHAEVYETQQTGSLVLVSAGNFGETGWTWVDHESPLSKQSPIKVTLSPLALFETILPLLDNAIKVSDGINYTRNEGNVYDSARLIYSDLTMIREALVQFFRKTPDKP